MGLYPFYLFLGRKYPTKVSATKIAGSDESFSKIRVEEPTSTPWQTIPKYFFKSLVLEISYLNSFSFLEIVEQHVFEANLQYGLLKNVKNTI